MNGVALAVWMTLSAMSGASGPAAAPTEGISLVEPSIPHQASLLGGAELDSSFKPSDFAPLRLTDGIRFAGSEIPALDQGGGMSSDLRQVLALLLGFIPGFGLGHLIAHDRDGFVLFLVIDVALYVLWGTVGAIVWHPFWGIGGAVWLVVHIIQALDAYAEAGGERIVQRLRENAVEIASRSLPERDAPVVTTRVFGFNF